MFPLGRNIPDREKNRNFEFANTLLIVVRVHPPHCNSQLGSFVLSVVYFVRSFPIVSDYNSDFLTREGLLPHVFVPLEKKTL